MRSSERPAGSRRREAPALVAILLAAIGIGFVRPVIAARFERLKVLADVYPFGSPAQMIVASLGHRSALADLIFAHVRVSYGLHFEDKRRFEFVGSYLDTVNTLDPHFRDAYRYADTFLTLAPTKPRLEDFVKAREIQERGRAEFPYDTELWLTSGQYLAYLAPSNLPTQAMKDAWRLEGAKVLSRACELASNNGNVPYHCIAAASLFNAAGEREAAIESMERLLAVTDDPAIERLALGFLGKRLDERRREQEERRRAAFREAWKRDLPFATKNLVLALGPGVDTGACAGGGHESELACATTWRDWARLSDPSAE